MTEFPATYGEVMAPLDHTCLPDDLRQLYASDHVFREWLDLADKVRRAEKISCWSQWTPEQHAAYEANDLLEFSRLRGYTEAEIADFTRFLSMTGELNEQHGEDFCMDVEFAVSQIVQTDALLAIHQELFRMSEAALANTNH